MLDTVNQVLFTKTSTVIYAVPPQTPVTEAALIMREIGIGALLVTDVDRLVGIVTERDIMTKVVADRRDPDETRIRHVMTEAPVYIPPHMPVRDAIALISDRHIRHLPVVDDDRVVGLLSSRDLMDWVIRDQARDIDSLNAAIRTVTRGKVMLGMR